MTCWVPGMHNIRHFYFTSAACLVEKCRASCQPSNRLKQAALMYGKQQHLLCCAVACCEIESCCCVMQLASTHLCQVACSFGSLPSCIVAIALAALNVDTLLLMPAVFLAVLPTPIVLAVLQSGEDSGIAYVIFFVCHPWPACSRCMQHPVGQLQRVAVHNVQQLG